MPGNLSDSCVNEAAAGMLRLAICLRECPLPASKLPGPEPLWAIFRSTFCLLLPESCSDAELLSPEPYRQDHARQNQNHPRQRRNRPCLRHLVQLSRLLLVLGQPFLVLGQLLLRRSLVFGRLLLRLGDASCLDTLLVLLVLLLLFLSGLFSKKLSSRVKLKARAATNKGRPIRVRSLLQGGGEMLGEVCG